MLFIFDENYSYKLAQGLKLIEQGNLKSAIQVDITHIKLLSLEGASDEDIIEAAGKKDGIIITMDKDFKHIKHYYQLYKQHNVGVVIFRSSKKVIYYWDIVVAFINRWESLKKLLSEDDRPFAYEINSRGVQKLHF